MPYVEGFGTWPFGEEWLWEAIACCYLPLLDLLDAREPAMTLSLTPVLCDQLGAPGLVRALRIASSTTPAGSPTPRTPPGCAPAVIPASPPSWSGPGAPTTSTRASAWRIVGETCCARSRRTRSWTSSATHAVLPLLATDAGARLQVQTGITSHLDRFGGGDTGSGGGRRAGGRLEGGPGGGPGGGLEGGLGGGWRGGFWLPECAHTPNLEPILAAAGVRRTCVELTGRYGSRRARAPAAARM